MREQAEAARAAYRLWGSDSRLGSVAAVIIVAVFIGWPLLRFWRMYRAGGERRS